MLRLRECIVLSRILSSASPIAPSLHRLLYAAAAPISPARARFAVEDYLVSTCGLTLPQAIKASAKLSRIRSPSNPDAVLSFLAGLGLSKADVAALVVKDPQFLCAGVERTLSPNVVELTEVLGVSRSEIARLVPLTHCYFRAKSISSKLQYYIRLFGSFEDLIRALKRSRSIHLLSSSLERVVKPNVAFMRECGCACDIAKPWIREIKLLTANPKHVRAMVVYAEWFGAPCGVTRGSAMFRQILESVAFRWSKVKITAKVEYLKKTFRWSDAEVGIAVSGAPTMLRASNEMLHRRSEFLLSEVGLESFYIARRPTMLTLSLEGRLRPRYYVVKFLKANGLANSDRSYNTIFLMSEKVFVEKFICLHKEAAPYLAEDYAASCRGELPTRFIFA